MGVRLEISPEILTFLGGMLMREFCFLNIYIFLGDVVVIVVVISWSW